MSEYTPTADAAYPEFTPTTEQVRSTYAHDPEAEYRDPVGFPSMQRENLRAFDRWLAAHDAEVRAEAESDPAKDERLVRYIAMATPLGYQSALTVVQQMTLMIQAETEARRAGVVAEEPEWEYGVMSRHGLFAPADNLAHALSMSARDVRYEGWDVVYHHKAGPWVPVEQGEV